ncbi:hypothetical protein GCM10010320_33740 [Streptomyces caelestis]|nr:hypothetical protein GCM10010320_33740 [Streptomyces caelestis]
MLEAESGIPFGGRKTPGDPRVFAQGLVIETGFFPRLAVLAGISFLAAHEPVTVPPAGGIRFQEEVFSDAFPLRQGKAGWQDQTGAPGDSGSDDGMFGHTVQCGRVAQAGSPSLGEGRLL